MAVRYVYFGETSTGVVLTMVVQSVFDLVDEMVVYAGGTAVNTTADWAGWMTIYHGGLADRTTVNYGGSVWVSSGGTANFTTVNSGGGLTIPGGTANSTTVNSGGVLLVDSGGSANNTTVNSGGGLGILPGGTANSTTINADGLLLVNSGGSANNTTVNSDGVLMVDSGGSANNTVINADGWMDVSSGGSANSTIINFYGAMAVYSGGRVNSTTINSEGYLFVYSGGTANNTSVNSGGVLYVSSGGTANSTAIDPDGLLHIYRAGKAKGITVKSGGNLYVWSSGTATDIRENGGFVYVGDWASVTFTPNSFGGLVLSSYATVHSGTTAISTTVNSGGGLTVYSGGTADAATVNSAGRLLIHNGGTVGSTTVNSGGGLGIYSGGTANNTSVNSGGLLAVDSGGVVSRCLVNNGATMALDTGAVLKGEIAIAGTVSATGKLDDSSKYSLAFNISECDQEQLILDGYEFLQNDNITSVTISVSGEKTEEGEYILLDNFDQNSPLNEIFFTVDGQRLDENYSGQYSFKWNNSEKKYTGVNYNGYNYVLSTENNNLTLSVEKNIHTLYIRLELGSDLDTKKLDQILKNNPQLNNINICVALNTKGKQANYYIVGSGASVAYSGLRPMSEILSDYSADSYSLFVSAHGSGLGFSGKSISVLADEIKESGKKIENLVWGTSCLNCSFEVAYALSKTPIKNIIGSEQLMWASTFDYDDFLKTLGQKQATVLSSDEIASVAFDTVDFWPLVNDTKSWLKADEDSIKSLSEQMDLFAEYVMTQIPKEEWGIFLRSRERSVVYSAWVDQARVDIYSFMNNVCSRFVSNTEIIGICNNIKDIITRSTSVVYKFERMSLISYGRIRGLSVYMPISGEFQERRYPKELSCSKWGDFVHELYDYAMGISLPEDKTDRSLPGIELGNGKSAADTGGFSSNVGFAGETAYGDGEDNFYTASLNEDGTAGDAISVAADNGSTLTLNVYDATGTTLLRSATGSGLATVSLAGINAGTIVYSVSADRITSFDIEYQTANDTGTDHLDLLTETGNETRETALALSDGYYKGLVANASNPDWYWIETVDAVEGAVGLWGGNIAEGNVSAAAGAADFQAYIDDALTSERIAFTWNAGAGMYVANYSGAGYLYVGGNSPASKGYNILCASVFEDAFSTAGDLNGDGRADVIMSITQSGHGAEGATGAWLIQPNQTAAWGDLSQRGEGWEIFGMGVTTAGKATNDVYIKNTDNIVGAWVTDDTGHVAGWETIGQFDAATRILGLGDFNADGQTDLLLRNVNGAVGCYFTSGEILGWNYFQSLGDEWKLTAVGDLNGDGRDDVVLKHDAGFAGSWLTQSDGTMVWANLDTLPDGFAVAGAGDFDGDGVDDVLLKKGTYYGAWLVENGSVKSWFGLGDLGSVAVEQIADFDGDGRDDLRIRTSAGDIGVQLVKGADTLEWHYYGSVGEEWSTSLAAI